MNQPLNTGRYGFKVTGNFIGRDGPGYNGKLLRDGKVVALVNDPGDGGCLHITDWASSEVKAEFEAFARSLPALVIQDHTLPMDAELLLGQMAEAELFLRWARKVCRKATVFQVVGDTENWRMLKAPYSAETEAHVRAQYGDQVTRILNTEI